MPFRKVILRNNPYSYIYGGGIFKNFRHDERNRKCRFQEKTRLRRQIYAKKRTNLQEGTGRKTKPKAERAEVSAFLNSLYAAG